MKRVCLIFLVVATFLHQAFSAYALYEESHEAINEYVATNTVGGFSLDVYLKDRLGMTGGVQEEFNGKAASFWVKKGGGWEDVPVWYMPYLRSVNHFHNPLTERGYSGLWGTGVLSGISSIQWALLPPNTQSPGGYYSWWDVRNYYFKALTPATEADRQRFYAETFRGLGQLTHLIQDASVPAHTRDDGHLFYNYETFVKHKPDTISTTPILPSNTLQGIANLIDTNQYVGSNPDVSTAIGLSEFTNANFFSEETIFAERLFPHPAKADTNMAVLEQLAEDGVLDKVSYVKHNVLGHRLAAASYFRYYDPEERLLEYRWYYQLDDHVYKDYASFLIPRAVGYSAALINYFFRGEVEITEMEEQRDATQAITGLKFKLKNITPEEEMKDGLVWIAYRYKAPGATEWTYGLSHPVPSGSVPSQSEVPYEVTFSTSIPSNASDLQYTYVFRGTLGAEQGAVVGKIITQDADLVILTWDGEIKGYRIRRNLRDLTYTLVPALPKTVWGPFDGVGVYADGIYYLPTSNSFEGLSVWDGRAFGVSGSMLRQQDLLSGAIVDTSFTIPTGYEGWMQPPRRCSLDGQTINLGLFSKGSYTETGEIKRAKRPPTFTSPILSYGAGELVLVDSVTESSRSDRQGAATYATFPSETVRFEGFLNDTDSFTWSARVNRSTSSCGSWPGPWNKSYEDHGSSERVSKSIRTEYTIIEGSEVLLVVDEAISSGSEQQASFFAFEPSEVNGVCVPAASGTRSANSTSRIVTTSHILFNGRSLLSFTGSRESNRTEANTFESRDYIDSHEGERKSIRSEITGRYAVLDAALSENQYLILYAFEENSRQSTNSTVLKTVPATVGTVNNYIATATASGSQKQKKHWGLLSPHFDHLLASFSYEETAGGELVEKHQTWDPPIFPGGDLQKWNLDTRWSYGLVYPGRSCDHPVQPGQDYGGCPFHNTGHQ